MYTRTCIHYWRGRDDKRATVKPSAPHVFQFIQSETFALAVLFGRACVRNAIGIELPLRREGAKILLRDRHCE